MSNHLAEIDFIGVYMPIAKSVAVVVATTEPTVVQHKQFRADFRRVVDIRNDTVGGKREVAALPRIEQHGFVFAVVAICDNVVAHKVMHVAAHAVYAVRRVAYHGLPRDKPIAVGKPPGKILVVDTVCDVGSAPHIAVGAQLKVAAVYQIKPYNFAVRVSRAKFRKVCKGIFFGRGRAKIA